MQEISDYFNDVYAAADRYWWRGPNRYARDPHEFRTALLTQMTLRLIGGREGMRVLDLGAGEGADSIRLALLGHHVDAVEISEVATGKIHAYATEAGVSVNVSTRDISAYRPVHRYDLILCLGVLHYIEDKPPVLRMMQDATVPGGLNVISLWSTYSAVPSFHNSVATFCDHEDGIVVEAYQHWQTEFIYFERNKAETSHTEMPGHVHSHIKLIARKRSLTR
jgi:2-polyprenyl-3-methyl-5-hydroxy-6-metoxy-1,4-benzoquinol methylase